jgi:hypothetical protein
MATVHEKGGPAVTLALTRMWLTISTALLPSVVLAEDTGLPPGTTERWGWLWIGLAAIFLIVLFAIWIPGKRSP